MPDKNLTDNEIVKAWEYCATKGNCSSCFLKAEEYCTNILKRLTIDLFNRQQAEIGRLSALAELGNTRANDYRVMRDRALKAEAEIERLRGKCENMQIGYNFAQDDIKTLKKDKYKLQKALNQSEDYRVMAKAEAYRECIEKAKEQCSKIPQYHFNLLNVKWYLDSLLKEYEIGTQPSDKV